MPKVIDINMDGVKTGSIMKYIIAFILIFIVLFVGCNSFQVIPAGYRGVKFNIVQGVIQTSLEEGIAFKIPLIESIYNVDVRVDKVEPHCSAASKDLQTVGTNVALNFRPDPSRVHDLYRTIGLAYRERVIDPAIQEAVKSVTALYTAEELITKREEIKGKIQDSLIERLRNENIIVIALNITDFQFSQSFNLAIEEKQTAEQHALKARRDLERIRIEAEQRITQAKAEAEAQRLLAASITPQVVELKRIDAIQEAIRKWNGTMPQVSGSAMPFWDIIKGQQTGK